MTRARPGRGPGRRWVVALATALALVVTACSSGSDDGDRAGEGEPAGPVLPPADAPADEAVRDGAYDWSRVPLGGGGFVTGMVTAVDGDEPVLYARTDVGGAYRWDTAERRWVQMLLTGTVEGDELGPGDYSVASIAVSPTDPDTVVLVAGADFNPTEGQEPSRTGRVLRSTDGGATWTSSDQRWFESGNQAFRTGSERIAIDPTDPERILLGTQREGLWTSTDGGGSWDAGRLRRRARRGRRQPGRRPGRRQPGHLPAGPGLDPDRARGRGPHGPVHLRGSGR